MATSPGVSPQEKFESTLHELRDPEKSADEKAKLLWKLEQQLHAGVDVNVIDVNAKNKKGNTPLHLAAMHNDANLAALLLVFGANAAIKNDQGKTALQLAQEDSLSMVAAVLRVMSDKPDDSHDRFTAEGVFSALTSIHSYITLGNQPNLLHVAVRNQNQTAIALLLEWHPDLLFIRDENKQTPLDLARETGDPEFVKYLSGLIRSNEGKFVEPVRGALEDWLIVGELTDQKHMLMKKHPISLGLCKRQDWIGALSKRLFSGLRNKLTAYDNKIESRESAINDYVEKLNTPPNSTSEKKSESSGSNSTLGNVVSGPVAYMPSGGPIAGRESAASSSKPGSPEPPTPRGPRRP